MRRLLLALMASAPLALAPAIAQTPKPALRIAAISDKPGPCGPPRASLPPGAQAYYRLLAQRLETQILTCSFPDRAAAAQALAAGQVDLAILNAAAYRPVAAATRSILTVRSRPQLGRVAAVVAVRKGDRRLNLAALKGASVVFGGTNRAYLDHPLRTLADQGASADYFGRQIMADSAEDAAAKLRAGEADAMVLHAGAWRRICIGLKASEWRCDDLAVAWRGRPRAQLAMVVRNDMPLETRYRLIGIHVAMHQEAPTAFDWAAAWTPEPAEFEPTEADALILTSSRGPE